MAESKVNMNNESMLDIQCLWRSHFNLSENHKLLSLKVKVSDFFLTFVVSITGEQYGIN